jgi:hypothetical protein
MPKTGRGIPSALTTSPLNKFPVKPGMRLSKYERLLDTKSGRVVTDEEASNILSSSPGTDLSRYQGVTNLTKLSSSTEGRASISERIAGPEGRTSSYKGFQFPEVSKVTGSNISRNEANKVDGFSYPSETNYKRSNRTEKQIQNLIQLDNLRSNKNATEPESMKPTSTTGEDIYTTARVTGQQDTTELIPEVRYTNGKAFVRPTEQVTNLTQMNKNFPSSFTESRIQSDISQNPNRYYATEDNYQRKEGNIGIGKNVKDAYEHMDFAGSMQAPIIPSYQTPRSGYGATIRRQEDDALRIAEKNKSENYNSPSTRKGRSVKKRRGYYN